MNAESEARAYLQYLARPGAPKPASWDDLHNIVDHLPGVLAKPGVEPAMDYAEWKALPEPERRQLVRKWVHDQGDLCALCFQALDVDMPIAEFGPAVDHRHDPEDPNRGPIRGVLHGRCNLHLSTVEARGESWTRRAVEYLRLHGAAFPERP